MPTIDDEASAVPMLAQVQLRVKSVDDVILPLGVVDTLLMVRSGAEVGSGIGGTGFSTFTTVMATAL